MNTINQRLNIVEASTVAPVKASNANNSKQLENNTSQASMKYLQRIVTRTIADLVEGTCVLVEPLVKAKCGDIVLCGGLNKLETMAVFNHQLNIIGTITHQWRPVA